MTQVRGGQFRFAPIPQEDASGFRGYAEKVFAPASGAEAAAILAEAASGRIPVTVAGAGTGLTGGSVAQGGWVLSTEKLRALGIRSGSAIAGAGLPLKDLHDAARRAGQLYAPDPTENTAAVGGAIATNASGARSFRYGATRRHVIALEVALMDGSLRRFRRGEKIDFDVPAIPLPATTKNTAGYALTPGMDWVDLFIGSEGTLGVVTEAELLLLPAVRELLTGVVFFPADAEAAGAVAQWSPVPGLRMLEYFDSASLDLLRSAYPEIPESAGAALLFEQELQSEDDADPWTSRIEAVGGDMEASWFASSDADRERFRRFRHALPEKVNDTVRRNGFMKLGTDYAVPLPRNQEMLSLYHSRLQPEFAGRYVIFGHIGDAHLHVNLLPASQDEFDRGREALLDLARTAVALGGTVSAEHGLGKRKRALLEIQYSREHFDAMREVKLRLDPQWLLGQGNLFSMK
ncbi:MAG: FAD-binding oxidoreductase [Acidobacteriia bacterium]|nr:FAD-binding oxidoreductase [Terriglobia bacterium]